MGSIHPTLEKGSDMGSEGSDMGSEGSYIGSQGSIMGSNNAVVCEGCEMEEDSYEICVYNALDAGKCVDDFLTEEEQQICLETDVCKGQYAHWFTCVEEKCGDSETPTSTPTTSIPTTSTPTASIPTTSTPTASTTIVIPTDSPSLEISEFTTIDTTANTIIDEESEENVNFVGQGIKLVQDVSGTDEQTSKFLISLIIIMLFGCGISCVMYQYKKYLYCCSSRVIEIGELEVADEFRSNELSKEVCSLSDFVAMSNELSKLEPAHTVEEIKAALHCSSSNELYYNNPRSDTAIYIPTNEAGEVEPEFTTIALEPLTMGAVNTEDCIE